MTNSLLSLLLGGNGASGTEYYSKRGRRSKSNDVEADLARELEKGERDARRQTFTYVAYVATYVKVCSLLLRSETVRQSGKDSWNSISYLAFKSIYMNM